MRFASLGSGSRGNGTLVQAGGTLVLVDCGFSVKAVEQRMDELSVTPEQLDALLVTHEHSDHCAGVAALSRKYDIPVYLTRGTEASGRMKGCAQQVFFHSEAGFRVGDIDVLPIAVPHDAREPCQFVLQSQGLRLGILTDLGSITAAVVGHYRDCHGLLLEFNHDEEMLASGPYPPPLKRRVGGDWGHLNNRQAAALLAELQHEALRHLVIAHISEKNNQRERVEDALFPVYDAVERVVWAAQDAGFGWLALDD
ncbi:MAG: MBL fold metallo-hydrolase [Halieaceae bacterium]|jgi:phosphoribosyl 1,2-cyclic phosphodiesterase|nr:MBL fold metallo-hydrolase [Halieaceae bacterium]